MEVLKLRYASGEITRDELQERIETINTKNKNAELFYLTLYITNMLL